MTDLKDCNVPLICLLPPLSKCILGDGSYSHRLRRCKFIHFCRIIEFFLHSRPIPQGYKYKCVWVCVLFFQCTVNNWLLGVYFTSTLILSFSVFIFLFSGRLKLFTVGLIASVREHGGGSVSLVWRLSFLFDVRVLELTSRDRCKQEHFKPPTLVIVWCTGSGADRPVRPLWQSNSHESHVAASQRKH